MRKRALRLIVGSVVLAGLSFAAYQHFYKQAAIHFPYPAWNA